MPSACRLGTSQPQEFRLRSSRAEGTLLLRRTVRCASPVRCVRGYSGFRRAEGTLLGSPRQPPSRSIHLCFHSFLTITNPRPGCLHTQPGAPLWAPAKSAPLLFQRGSTLEGNVELSQHDSAAPVHQAGRAGAGLQAQRAGSKSTWKERKVLAGSGE